MSLSFFELEQPPPELDDDRLLLLEPLLPLLLPVEKPVSASTTTISTAEKRRCRRIRSPPCVAWRRARTPAPYGSSR